MKTAYFQKHRLTSQAVANSHIETSKSLEGSVPPILKRLHGEIKNKNKELSSGAGKSAKAVDAARNATQKHIELLGQHSAAFDSTGGKPDSHNDPYVVRRNIQHSLHKQVLEENNSRQDLISVQRNFEAFEAHVLQTIQQAMGAFLQFVGGRSDREKAIYSDVVGTVQRIPHEFEWMNFLHRNGDMMIDPSAPPREVSHISYPNQDHASAKPLIAGTLERKGRGVGSLTGFKTGFYVVTPSKYLHQFADDDDFRKDPTPELSLYLPDCTIGAVSDTKFHIKGKDASKGKVGSAFQMTHELSFKAHTPADAQKWHAVMTQSVGSHTNDPPPASAATSPTSPTDKHPTPLQTGNLSHGQTTGSAGPQTSSTANTNVTPSSAAPATGNPTTPATSTTMSPGAGALGKETF